MHFFYFSFNFHRRGAPTVSTSASSPQAISRSAQPALRASQVELCMRWKRQKHFHTRRRGYFSTIEHIRHNTFQTFSLKALNWATSCTGIAEGEPRKSLNFPSFGRISQRGSGRPFSAPGLAVFFSLVIFRLHRISPPRTSRTVRANCETIVKR